MSYNSKSSKYPQLLYPNGSIIEFMGRDGFSVNWTTTSAGSGLISLYLSPPSDTTETSGQSWSLDAEIAQIVTSLRYDANDLSFRYIPQSSFQSGLYEVVLVFSPDEGNVEQSYSETSYIKEVGVTSKLSDAKYLNPKIRLEFPTTIGGIVPGKNYSVLVSGGHPPFSIGFYYIGQKGSYKKAYEICSIPDNLAHECFIPQTHIIYDKKATLGVSDGWQQSVMDTGILEIDNSSTKLTSFSAEVPQTIETQISTPESLSTIPNSGISVTVLRVSSELSFSETQSSPASAWSTIAADPSLTKQADNVSTPNSGSLLIKMTLPDSTSAIRSISTMPLAVSTDSPGFVLAGSKERLTIQSLYTDPSSLLTVDENHVTKEDGVASSVMVRNTAFDSISGATGFKPQYAVPNSQAVTRTVNRVVGIDRPEGQTSTLIVSSETLSTFFTKPVETMASPIGSIVINTGSDLSPQAGPIMQPSLMCFLIFLALLIMLFLSLWRWVPPYWHYTQLPSVVQQERQQEQQQQQHTSRTLATVGTALTSQQSVVELASDSPSTALQQNLIWELGDENRPGSVRIEIGPGTSRSAVPSVSLVRHREDSISSSTPAPSYRSRRSSFLSPTDASERQAETSQDDTSNGLDIAAQDRKPGLLVT